RRRGVVALPAGAPRLSKNLPVTLNLFQGPCAVSRHTSAAPGSNDRAWMLKQVQHDEAFGAKRNAQQKRHISAPPRLRANHLPSFATQSAVAA
ncbi:MAG TPA: hypothetical protein VK980_11085, partial [Sphingomonas sp.]|nr:hypothetical protein [Sphingomonas sp.]